VRDRDAIPAAQSIDVLFHEFMADDLAMVEQIYARAALAMTAQAREQLRQFLADHPRGRDGRVVYNLRGDFGVEPAQLRERFAFYFDRFPVQVEVQ
jgi:outer membrane protein assembly factor BamD (BamD/ComL family)